MSYAFVLSTSAFIEHTPFNRGVFTMKLHYFPPAPGSGSIISSDDSFPSAQVAASGETFGTVEGPGSTTKINSL